MTSKFSFIIALCGVLFTSTAMAQVSVSTKLPATVEPGGSFTVELNVTKADVSGFAKLQQQLPTGFTATVGENANATFSFKDRKVKFLWMALPNNDFMVSYNVKVDESLSGNQIIEGTFAYILDNETKKFIIPKDIITVKAAGEDAQQAAMDQILADQKAKDDAAAAAREAAAETEEVVEHVEHAETTEEVVEEVVEEVADNSAAEEAEAAAEEAKHARETEEARKAEQARKAEEARREATAAEETREEHVEHTEAPANYNDAMMEAKPGLVFRVQVAAGPNQIAPSFFEEKYGISESVVIEEHEGMFKYVVGEFGSYRPAKTFSNELRDSNNVNGPFVTAYHDGVRIHVKEALEIAGQ
ncbi:MAG: hypothetical protein JKX84_07135 [Flavobacteriales bacterium]|nr:hypothetical protein [Flavobacteriales bacterium]